RQQQVRGMRGVLVDPMQHGLAAADMVRDVLDVGGAADAGGDVYDSGAVLGFEAPTQTRGYNNRNFKSTALASNVLGVDEDEGDAAWLLAAIDPGVNGALLHQH